MVQTHSLTLLNTAKKFFLFQDEAVTYYVQYICPTIFYFNISLNFK